MKHPSLPAALVIGIAVSTVPAAAAPPEGALPLSQVLQSLEGANDIAHFSEIEWDDSGYWEIEYRGAEGGETEIRIDPRSGEILP